MYFSKHLCIKRLAISVSKGLHQSLQDWHSTLHYSFHSSFDGTSLTAFQFCSTAKLDWSLSMYRLGFSSPAASF